MRRAALPTVAAASGAVLALGTAAASPGPNEVARIVPIAEPRDVAFPGTIHLQVDATDVFRRVVHVHETVTGLSNGAVLLYPKWLPGWHAPGGPIDRLAGIRMSEQGTAVSWVRDPVDVYAFRVHLAPGHHALDVDFDYLSPVSPDVGNVEISHDLLMLEWNEVVLYPAGYYVRQIPVDAELTLPEGWSFATALTAASPDAAAPKNGAPVAFERVSLATLVDSPVYAGRYAKRLDLDPGGRVPVRLDLFADRPERLAMKPEQLAAHRALVQQAYRLFGSHHYAHYDFLYSLSDQVQENGLEHHQSSEDGSDPDTYTDWDKTAYERDLLPHEFTHSWNGKFRRPADLWTPNYNVPMQDSLLWVYEGLTQYWGKVLAARSGLRTRQQALDDLALNAAYAAAESARGWRPLEDTTNDEIINPRRPQSWRDQQGFEDYYNEGALVWLDADTLIRERSQGRRSLDDFARAFFGIHDGSVTTVTYTLEDVVRALDGIEPYDWAAFFRERLQSVGARPLDGIGRGGYRLTYTGSPSAYLSATNDHRKRLDLLYSVGLAIDDKAKGTVLQVLWGSPAFKAGLTQSMQLLAVDGIGYEDDVLEDAIRAAQRSAAPIELIVKNGDRFSVVKLDYHGGLRFPHLERDPSVPPRLDDILSAR